MNREFITPEPEFQRTCERIAIYLPPYEVAIDMMMRAIVRRATNPEIEITEVQEDKVTKFTSDQSL